MSYLKKLYNLVKTLNINDDNKEKCCGVSTDFIRKLTGLFFLIIGEKASTNIPLSKNYHSIKSVTLTCLYGPRYLELDDYPPYSDKRSIIFETHNNRNLRYSHGHTNCVRHTDLITWVSKHSWEMLLSDFSHAEIISACPRTIVINKCEQNNIIGEILNAGDNVDDQEDFRSTGSYFKINPTVLDEYTKKKISEYATRYF